MAGATLPILPPAPILAVTAWSKAMPLAAIVALACLVIGGVLLLGGDVRGGLKRSTQRVEPSRRCTGSPRPSCAAVDEPKHDEAAA